MTQNRPLAAASWAEAMAMAEQAYTTHNLPQGREAAWQVWSILRDPVPANASQRQRRGRAAFLLAHFLYRLGHFDELLLHGPPAADALGESGGHDSACQVLRWMALGAAEIGAFEAAFAAAQRGLELAERHGERAAHVLLTNALAACFERMGDPWQAERLLRQALAAAQELDDDIPRFVTFNNLSATALTRYYLLRAGDDEEEAVAALRQGREDAAQGLPLAERIGDPFYCFYVLANLGDILNFLGEHDAAERQLLQALSLARGHRFDSLVRRVECSLGELALERGRPQQAFELLWPLADAMGDAAPPTTVRRTQHALYRALRQLGRTDEALRCFERFQRLEHRRMLDQLRGQAQHLVTRVEIERAYRDASYHRERASSLAETASRDVLTGLSNRRGLEQQLLAMLPRPHPHPPLPLSVALIDLDNLKPINDRLGHAAGDEALKRVARVLKRELRQQDLVARIGGDEFALVLPEVDEAVALTVVERIRQSARLSADDPGAVPLTLSVGLAMVDTLWDGIQPLGEWLAAADVAMYEGKRQGGDRVVLHRR